MNIPLYSSIVEAYESIFPLDSGTADFLAQGLRPGAGVLDLACGTGAYARELARRGFAVCAMDLDGPSIEYAIRKSGNLAVSPRFLAADMRDAGRLFSGQRFALIHCIGNSLVHLPDRESIARVLATVRSLLETRGRLILQIINYDRILKDRVPALPTIVRNGYRFVRHYDHLEGQIIFRSELYGLNPEDPVCHQTPLLPLRRAELEAILEAEGYHGREWFGDLAADIPWSPDAYATVVQAQSRD